MKRIGAWFRREDYQMFKSLAPDDTNLPDTFDEWADIASRQVAQLEADGATIEKVMINPSEFSAWCKASGLKPNGPSRAAFAIHKASGQKVGNA